MKLLLLRLDQVAGALNPWLLVAAIGLGAVDATVLVALRGPTFVASLTDDAGGIRASRERVDSSWSRGAINGWADALLGSR
jgi:hypothetical protein